MPLQCQQLIPRRVVLFVSCSHRICVKSMMAVLSQAFVIVFACASDLVTGRSFAFQYNCCCCRRFSATRGRGGLPSCVAQAKGFYFFWSLGLSFRSLICFCVLSLGCISFRSLSIFCVLRYFLVSAGIFLWSLVFFLGPYCFFSVRVPGDN